MRCRNGNEDSGPQNRKMAKPLFGAKPPGFNVIFRLLFASVSS